MRTTPTRTHIRRTFQLIIRTRIRIIYGRLARVRRQITFIRRTNIVHRRLLAIIIRLARAARRRRMRTAIHPITRIRCTFHVI